MSPARNRPAERKPAPSARQRASSSTSSRRSGGREQAGGISNRPVPEEEGRQARLPPRGKGKEKTPRAEKPRKRGGRTSRGGRTARDGRP
jgi:hypothetical protein